MSNELAKSSAKFSNEPGNEYIEISVVCNKIPSVNSMYVTNYKTKKKFDAPDTAIFRHQVAEQIAVVDPVKNCKSWLKRNGAYCIYYEFLINHSYNKRDCDNLIKVVQDVFCRALHSFDDNRIREVHAYKGFINSDKEIVRIRLCKSDYDHLKYNVGAVKDEEVE